MSKDVIHIEITYNSPIKKVWEALIDVEKIKKWYFEVPTFTPEVGVEFEFYKPGHKREFLHRCRILKVAKESLLQYTWSYPGHVEGESVVTWELIPRGGATSLRLTHEGLLNHKSGGESFSTEKFEIGWQNILGKSLANYLER